MSDVPEQATDKGPVKIPVNFNAGEPTQPEANTASTDSIEERVELLDRIKRIEAQQPAEGQDLDDLVRSYEERYANLRDKSARLETPEPNKPPEASQPASPAVEAPATPKPKPAADEDIWGDIPAPSWSMKSQSGPSMSAYAGVTEDERKWAALAHASMLLTLILGLASGGMVALFTIFIPLVIYFMYRRKSDFVAYQALQSFALQALGTVGWIIVLLTGVTIGGILSVVLAITVVGIPAAFVALLATILFAVASLGLPLAMIIYGSISAWETYQGIRYRIPFLGDWLDRQMRSGFLKSL